MPWCHMVFVFDSCRYHRWGSLDACCTFVTFVPKLVNVAFLGTARPPFPFFKLIVVSSSQLSFVCLCGRQSNLVSANNLVKGTMLCHAKAIFIYQPNSQSSCFRHIFMGPGLRQVSQTCLSSMGRAFFQQVSNLFCLSRDLLVAVIQQKKASLCHQMQGRRHIPARKQKCHPIEIKL